MVDARTILSLKKHYKLCKQCSERHGFAGARSEDQCYICRGLMDDIDSIAKKILRAVKGYEFDTFLIGATLPTQIYEREDALRARLKIRGVESAKNQLTRELGMRLSRLLRKRVDYLKPDVTVNLAIDKENNIDIAIKSRPLAIAGRYVKTVRGISQKQDRCPSCEGRGCDSCKYSGLSGFDSIEGAIADGLIEMTGGQTPKFSWIGSEDQGSLVLGSGRPFYARVFNPKKRNLKKKHIRKAGIMRATISVLKEEPKLQPRFRVRTRIHARCEREITKGDIKKLGALAGAEVNFENKFKTATKKIYSARARKIDDKQFMLAIVADGGLMIKQFVGGEEYMKPNVSEIVGAKCECISFDVLDVSLQ